MDVKLKIITLVVFLTSGSADDCTGEKPKWQLQSDVIVKGKDVEIKCIVDQLNPACTRKWTRGQESKLVMFDGQPTRSVKGKYSERHNADGFIIVIKNISEEDLKTKYTCVYGFLEDHGIIPSNEFIVLPTKSSVNQSVSLTSTEVRISINFSSIYPLPNCDFFLGDSKLEFYMKYQKTGHDYQVLYSIDKIISINEQCIQLEVACKLVRYEELWEGIRIARSNPMCKGIGSKQLYARLEVFVFLAVISTILKYEI